MRRRITLATVGVTLLALVLSGAFTLVLARRAAITETKRELRAQATDIASQAASLPPRALGVFGRALQLESVDVVQLDRTGAPTRPLPSVVDMSALVPGQVSTGNRGSLVWAVAPVVRTTPGPPSLVVVTQRSGSGLGRAGVWFAASALVSLLVAWLVADRLGRRLTHPLVVAEHTTRRIAAGDLTARVDVEHADDEVTSLAQSINSMAASLDRARRLERQFLLAVSHDLRTPLTSIRGFAEAIADGAAEDHTRAAGVIAAESRRLERLVGDLLELAKLDARRFSLDVRRTDLTEVAVDTAEAFRPELDEAGVRLVVHVPPSPVYVAADPDRLAQVLANLVENGLKFARSSITVAVHGTELVVDDDGPGIAPDEAPRVFDRLYQSARMPARKVGSGLGLAIVRELVSAMDGTVAVGPTTTGTRMIVRMRPWISEPSSSTAPVPTSTTT